MNTSADRQSRLDGQGLYVHVPFCETKCGYCDFFSVAVKDRNPSPLVDRIILELQHRTARLEKPIRTIFVGGGTPTILSPRDLFRLLGAIKSAIDLRAIVEFTVEANPATVDDEKAAILVDAGVTRVSMGAQSFLDDELAALERIHTATDIPPSVETLRRAGIKELNLDLIFGIPNQTPRTWALSLERAIELKPDHLACYGLTYEPGTRLTAQREHGRVVPCDERLESTMFTMTVETLAQAAFRQYEISNFAKPGSQSEHNLLYWRNAPYIGVGPSAAGCDGHRRYKNVADIAAYTRLMDTQNHAEAETETLTDDMTLTEIVMMQLRLNEGISKNALHARFATDPRVIFETALPQLIEQGLLTDTVEYIALTDQGRLVANTVMTDLACAASDWVATSRGS